MIQTLVIENVALIEKTTLEFDDKLNCISGETGSGKSIMLDALSFVFGGRTERSLIREGSGFMRVKVIFCAVSDKVKTLLKQDYDIDCDDELYIVRELDIKGKNSCKINGETVPVMVVKKVCSMLVDLHGQSEHLAILNNAYQLKILDLYSKIAEDKLVLLNKYIDEVNEIDREIKSLGGSEAEKANLIDLYTYQINEIDNARIGVNEYDELLSEKKEMSQFEKINNVLKQVYESCARNPYNESAQDKIHDAVRGLSGISDINDNYQQLESRLKSVLLELEDINDTVSVSLRNNIFDQDRFDYIDNRLDLIKSLFRKYGGDYNKLNDYYISIQSKLNNLINSTERYHELTDEKEQVLTKIDILQEEITKIRKQAAKELSNKMQVELVTLGMPNARMDVEFSNIAERYSRDGKDAVEFMFSANLGFDLKPLNKVVSGGEMSRVMLAYKIVVASVDDIGTIIFDEIDSGISGYIAQVVAEYMARLSHKKQILAVSHLPQICAMADHNVKVEKLVDANTTHTISSVLTGVSLYEEIARLMGVAINDTGLKVSRELKENNDKYKEKIG